MIDCCLTFLKLEVYAKPNVLLRNTNSKFCHVNIVHYSFHATPISSPDECPTIGRFSIFMLKKNMTNFKFFLEHLVENIPLISEDCPT